jgi:hypothetical protein
VAYGIEQHIDEAVRVIAAEEIRDAAAAAERRPAS